MTEIESINTPLEALAWIAKSSDFFVTVDSFSVEHFVENSSFTHISQPRKAVFVITAFGEQHFPTSYEDIPALLKSLLKIKRDMLQLQLDYLASCDDATEVRGRNVRNSSLNKESLESESLLYLRLGSDSAPASEPAEESSAPASKPAEESSAKVDYISLGEWEGLNRLYFHDP